MVECIQQGAQLVPCWGGPDKLTSDFLQQFNRKLVKSKDLIPILFLELTKPRSIILAQGSCYS